LLMWDLKVRFAAIRATPPPPDGIDRPR